MAIFFWHFWSWTRCNFQHFTESRFTLVLCCDFPFTPDSHNYRNSIWNHSKIGNFFTQNHAKSGKIAIYVFHTLDSRKFRLQPGYGIGVSNILIMKPILIRKSPLDLQAFLTYIVSLPSKIEQVCQTELVNRGAWSYLDKIYIFQFNCSKLIKICIGQHNLTKKIRIEFNTVVFYLFSRIVLEKQ